MNTEDYDIKIYDIFKVQNEQLEKLVKDFQSKIKDEIARICDENNLDFEITPRHMHLYYRGTLKYADDNEDISILLSFYRDTFNKDMPVCKYTNGKWEE